MTVDLVSDEQLAEWERRVEAATDGEWYVQRRSGSLLEVRAAWPDEDQHLASVEYLSDADLIVAARNAFPLLLRALRDARARLLIEQEGSGAEIEELATELAEERTLHQRTVTERDSLRAETAAAEKALAEAGLDPAVHGGLYGAVTLLIGLWAAPTGQPDQTRVHSPSTTGGQCGCARCDSERRARLPWPERMCAPFIVCPDCGDKRCPRAAWHGNACAAAPTGQEDEHGV